MGWFDAKDDITGGAGLAAPGPGDRAGASAAAFGGADQRDPRKLPLRLHGGLLGRPAGRRGGPGMPQAKPRQAVGPVQNRRERDHARAARCRRAGGRCTCGTAPVRSIASRPGAGRQAQAGREAQPRTTAPGGSCAGDRTAQGAAVHYAGKTHRDIGDLPCRRGAIMQRHTGNRPRPARLPGGKSGEPVAELLRRDRPRQRAIDLRAATGITWLPAI